MEQILEKLFESVPKARLLKLFMRNPESEFTLQDIISRSQIRTQIARSELNKLINLDLVNKKKISLKYELRSRSKKRGAVPKIVVKTKKCQVYSVNPDFEVLPELRDLVAKSSVASRKKLIKQIKNLGKIKLAVISGIFLNNDLSRTDLLIVGDNVKKTKLDNFLANVESELGKSLRYTLMDSAEFKYRIDMYDRFLRDILEHPHDKLLNKVNI